MIQYQRQDHPVELDALARRLEATGDYRVLRRLVPRQPLTELPGACEKSGIIIDLETTGLEVGRDEIIEIAMLKFRYVRCGEVVGVSDVFQAFQQPSHPIPYHITSLTGINDAMVAGRTIDASAVEAFVADPTAEIVIAHHAGFDRKFAELAWPIFAHKPWACSATEIDWKKHGFSGAKLSYLSTEAGFFYQAHRAVDDCHAVLELLAQALPATSQTALSVLIERAGRRTYRIWAERSPYNLKDILKRRGYRWSDGAGGSLRSWYIDVDEGCREAELKFLRDEIYRRDVEPRWLAMSAFERFSARQDHCGSEAGSAFDSGGDLR